MAANATPRRIMVVDRKDTFRHHLVRRLLRDGYDACAVADSLSAFRLARWFALDTAIIGEPADVAADRAPGVLRHMVAFIIRLSHERLARQHNYDVVLPRTVDLDALCLIVGRGRVAPAAAPAVHDSAGADLCAEEIRSGLYCGRKRGHGGLHRWGSPDAGRSFVWG